MSFIGRAARIGTNHPLTPLTTLLLILSAASINVAYYALSAPALQLLMLTAFASVLYLSWRGRHPPLSRGIRWMIVACLCYAGMALLAAGRAGFDSDALNRLDKFSYFLAAACLIPFLAARRLRARTFWLSIAAAALLSGGHAWWEMQTLAGPDGLLVYRAGGSKGKPIPFGDLSILLAMLSLLGACVAAPRQRWHAGLLLAAALAGGYAAFVSGTRSAWGFAPIGLTIIGIYLARRYPRLRLRILAGIAIAALAGGVLLAQSDLVAKRLMPLITQAEGYRPGVDPGLEDPVGARFELWRAAARAFADHPVLGIGVGQFNGYLKDAAEQGEVARSLTHFNQGQGHTHAHNDYLHAMATRGLPGLLSLLGIYLVALALFARAAWHGRDEKHIALGYAGMLTVFGYMEFSMTDSVLLARITSGYYILLCGWLLALLLPAMTSDRNAAQ